MPRLAAYPRLIKLRTQSSSSACGRAIVNMLFTRDSWLQNWWETINCADSIYLTLDLSPSVHVCTLGNATSPLNSVHRQLLCPPHNISMPLKSLLTVSVQFFCSLPLLFLASGQHISVIYSFIYSFIHLFIHSFIHSFIDHWFNTLMKRAC